MENLKTIKYLFLFFCTLMLNSCISVSSAFKFPHQSFVKVHTKMTIEICQEDKNSMSSCSKESFYSVGSGSVVWHKNSKTYFLTAGHVCHAEVQDHLKSLVTNVKMQFKVQNTKNEYYDVTVTNIAKEFLNGNELDLCLLESDGIISMPKIHIALSGPKIGEVVYNVAAPTGFFHPPTVPLLSGYHSGPLGKYHSLITVPATGGSSGSPVINSDGELVGLIFAANMQFPHLAIGIRYEHLKKYLQEELYSNPSL